MAMKNIYITTISQISINVNGRVVTFDKIYYTTLYIWRERALLLNKARYPTQFQIPGSDNLDREF
jgi:hypothetical protein